jgi:hypothetical protein
LQFVENVVFEKGSTFLKRFILTTVSKLGHGVFQGKSVMLTQLSNCLIAVAVVHFFVLVVVAVQGKKDSIFVASKTTDTIVKCAKNPDSTKMTNISSQQKRVLL